MIQRTDIILEVNGDSSFITDYTSFVLMDKSMQEFIQIRNRY